MTMKNGQKTPPSLRCAVANVTIRDELIRHLHRETDRRAKGGRGFVRSSFKLEELNQMSRTINNNNSLPKVIITTQKRRPGFVDKLQP